MATRARPRVRRGFKPHSFFSRPNARSTAPRPRYRSPNRLLSRGISGWSREAFRQTDFGLALAGRAAPLGSLRLKSAPANVHVAVLAGRRRCSPRLTAGVFRAGSREHPVRVAGVVDGLRVVALVERRGLRRRRARLTRASRSSARDASCAPRRLNLPGDGKLSPSANGGVELVSVEASALARADRRNGGPTMRRGRSTARAPGRLCSGTAGRSRRREGRRRRQLRPRRSRELARARGGERGKAGSSAGLFSRSLGAKR